MATTADAERLLRERFGHEEFREGQREAVGAALAGRDLLVVMPTGAGKSLCYQLPALLVDGWALVVSPLIALMKDQVDQLEERGIAAATVHSGLSAEEKRAVARKLQEGSLRLLLVAPERFRSARFLEFVKRMPPHRLVIDEAHCISQWGHDFRPDYGRLGEVVELLGRPPVSALTATATPVVRDDVTQQLGLREPVEILTGFDRPSLSFEVVPAPTRADKLAVTERLVRETDGVALIYAASRRSVEQLTDRLRAAGRDACAYHAGLEDRTRSAIQDRFMRGDVEVLVATNAFGMGVDKADIRLVLHFDMPGSLEAYYQEAGRAGRDGDPARCVLLGHGGDYRLQRFFLDGANPGIGLVRALHRALSDLAAREPPGWATLAGLRSQLGERNDGAFATALRMLQGLGQARVLGDEVHPRPDLAAACPVDAEHLAVKRRRDEHRLGRMLDYTRATRGCRRARIREYFVGDGGQPCGACDLCRRKPTPARAPNERELTRVRHALRTVASLDFRFGPHRIAQVLAGSETADLLARGLDRLPTYGIFAGCGTSAVRRFLDYLEEAGLLARQPFQSQDGRRTGHLLGLTDIGRRLDRGEIRPALPEPPPLERPVRERPARAADCVEIDATARPLLDRLRAFRGELARAAGRPAYTVFNDETMALLATDPPADRDAFLAVKGLGPKRWETFGPALLAAIEAQRAVGN